MQIQLQDAAPQMPDDYSGLIEIDHSSDGSSSIRTEADFTQIIDANYGLSSELDAAAIERTIQHLPLAGEVIFNDPNLVHDVHESAPAQQDFERTVAPATEVSPQEPLRVQYRNPRDTFAYAATVGANVENARNLSLKGSEHHRQVQKHDLMVKESKLGAMLFGPVPKNTTRSFFCLDNYTWVWHETGYDKTTKTTTDMNVQYDFQERGVLKMVNGEPRGYVEGSELTHLLSVIKTYHDRVLGEIYGYTLAE